MINTKTSLVSIAIAFILISIVTFQLPNLEFDYELENFFPGNDPDLAYYQKFTKTFGYDNDYLLLGFEAPESLFDSIFLEKIEKGLEQISEAKATIQVLSPTSMKVPVKSPLGIIPIPLLHIDRPEKLLSDSAKLYQHELYREMFISKQNNALKVIVIHERFESKEAADHYVALVRQTFEDLQPRLRIAGKAIAQSAFINAVKEDFSKFLVLALLLVFVLLLIFMRHLPMIITTLLIAGLSVVATIGFMALAGKKIDVLSSLIPTILLVVSLSDILHLFSYFQSEYARSLNMKAALTTAVKKVGLATLLTSFTTAIGFLTLISINVKPIIDLGLYAALGIFFAFIITYLLFPSILWLIQPKFTPSRINQLLSDFLRKTLRIVLKKGKVITSISALVLVSGIIGINRLEIDAFLVNDLPQHDQVKSDFIFFDRDFSGSKPFTLSLQVKDSTLEIYSKEIILQITKIEDFVKQHIGSGDLISPATIVKMANQSLNGGKVEYYSLPSTDRQWKRVLNWIHKTHPERKSIKVSEDRQAQVTGYFRDLGSKDATHKQANLIQSLDQSIDRELIDYRLTGTTLLVDKSHQMLSTNLIRGLLIALVIVSIIAGVMFRSWLMIVITLIPNLFPLLIVAAIMGYFKIPLNLSTSVIYAISFGIVVDDTIHFLSRFKQELQNGRTKVYAVKASILGTGEPILITTIMLTAGFMIFCFSNFSASFYLGLFVSISFLTALLADIFLLPLLILRWLPDQKTKK